MMSGRNFEKLIEGMTAGYCYGKVLPDQSVNPEDFLIIDTNNAFEKQTGFKKENLINKKLSDVLPCLKTEAPDLIKNCCKTAITGVNTEFDQYIKMDRRWFSIHISSQEKYYLTAIIHDITEIKKIEKERIERALMLDQRVKEMNLLIMLSQLMQKQGLTIEMFFEETVNLIPSAFRYPEITAARIKYKDLSYSTHGNLEISTWILSENITIREKISGSIEVWCTEEIEDMDEGPFLQEELSLINTLARYMEKVAEKIEADEAVLHGRLKFQQYMKNAPDSIFITDKTGHCIEMNPAACLLLGYTEKEILNMSLYDVIPSEKKMAGAAALKILSEKGQLQIESVMIRKDGSTVAVELRAVGLPDGTFMAFCRDITERKRTEKQLIEMASFHKTLIDTIPAPVFYKDIRGKYLGMNKPYTDYFGLSENEMIGKYSSDIVHSKFSDIVKIKDDELYKKNDIQIYEHKVTDFNGNSHDVIFHKAVFKDLNENPEGIIGVLLDITDMKKAQNDLVLYFKAIQSVDQPIIITDKNGDIVEVNEAFSKIYGYSKESVKGQNPRILNPGITVYHNFGYSDDEYNKLFGRLWKDITNPDIGTWEGIIINKKKDNSLIWIKLIVNTVYGKTGEASYFIALPIDISSNIQREALTKIQLYQTIASLSELRDNETGNHMRRVGIFTKLLARAKARPEKYCNDIEIFSQLHDIGKVGILDSILLSDRRLTEEEMKIMQSHTVLGFNIVKGIKEMEMAATITLCHHERYDGSGYPKGLKKEKIPLSARITAIADVYDSLRSRRTYKREWLHEEARDYILQKSGIFFDPELVDLFSGLEKKFDAVYTDLRY